MVLSLSAQDKVTKEKVVGTWALTVVEMKNTFYFDIEKDSLALGSAITAQLGDNASQIDMVKNMMKAQMAVIKSLYFKLNADGTAEFNAGGSPKQGTYVVDEEKSTITTIEKGEKSEKETLPASFVDGKLKLVQSQAEGEFVMLLKKK